MRNPPHLLSMYFAQLTLQKGLHKHVPYGLPILHHITRETSTSFCLMDCIRRVVHIARYSAQNLFVLYLGERSLSAQQRTYLCILLLPNPFDIEAEFKVLFETIRLLEALYLAVLWNKKHLHNVIHFSSIFLQICLLVHHQHSKPTFLSFLG